MSRQEIEASFPNLPLHGYDITSPATPDYNCIAWAAQDIDSWWWPDPFQIYYWPAEAPRDVTVDAFIKAYESQGFVVCQSPDYEVGWEKIAIYIDNSGLPTHAARQLNSGQWTSKLGRLEDIMHARLDSLSGNVCGVVSIIMRRRT
ncbi:MAG: DUF7689 domain-containing protein [Nitrospirota bacterium]